LQAEVCQWDDAQDRHVSDKVRKRSGTMLNHGQTSSAGMDAGKKEKQAGEKRDHGV